MTLVNLTMVPSIANVIDGSFFEELVRAFMELDSCAEATLPCPVYISAEETFGFGVPTRLGQLGHFRPCPHCASVVVPTTLTYPYRLRENLPTDISEIMELCDKPPLERFDEYRFSYHFCNHRIGCRLVMDFFYWAEPNDFRGWDIMRYSVDSVICDCMVDRPLPRMHVVLQGDVLLDSLAFLSCDYADMAQLVCRAWRRSIDANASVLPLRQFAEVQVETVAPELCRVIYGLSSVGFTFRRHVSFDDLWVSLQTALKRSRIGLLVLKGDVDDYLGFRLLDSLSPSVIIEELRLDFRCQYKPETLTAVCKKAVDAWKTRALGLYNPQHTQWIFGDPEITRKLGRLEISVPTIDCRRELDALLFGNPHLEARLQFIYGNFSGGHFSTCMEESFFVHYFHSVFRRISDDTRAGVFVDVLYIRSIFEFFPVDRDTPAIDDSRFLRSRVPCETGGRETVEDEGMKFQLYDAGSESQRYQVYSSLQHFFNRPADDHATTLTSVLNYYMITRKDLSLSGRAQQHRRRFADWFIHEANWEQLYAANDWLPTNRTATRFKWLYPGLL